jgi:hypothetical protein
LHKIVVCVGKNSVLNNLHVLEAVKTGRCYAGVLPQLINMFLVLEVIINSIIKFKLGFKISFRKFIGTMGDFGGQFVKNSLSKGFDFLFYGFATFSCQNDESCNKIWVEFAFHFPIIELDGCGAGEIVGLILKIQIIKTLFLLTQTTILCNLI